MGTLGYESRATRVRWGPWLVVPSWRTAALLVLAAAATAWVFARHEPWVLVAKMDLWADVGKGVSRVAFTPEGTLLLFADDGRLNLHDPATGGLLKTVWKTEKKRLSLRFLRGAREFLVLADDEPFGWVFDVASSTLVRRTPNPFMKNGGRALISAADDDAYRVLVEDDGGRRPRVEVWDLSRPPGRDDGPRYRLGEVAAAHLTREGRLIVTEDERGDLDILRADDLSRVRRVNVRDPMYSHGSQVAGGYVLTVVEAPNDESQRRMRLLVEEIASGALRADLPFEWPSASPHGRLDQVSSDGSRALVSLFFFHGADCAFTALVDVKENRVLEWTISPASSAPTFLPGSSLLLCHDDRCPGAKLVDRPSRVPLAVLPQWPWGTAVLSGDGQTLVCEGSYVAFLYRRPGPECRMSRLGILGMPHVWLMLGACAGAAASWVVDARRRPHGTAADVPGWVTWGVGGAALLATLYVLLSGALGQWRWEALAGPGVLAGILLAQARSRAGRVALIAALAAAVIISGEAARRELAGGAADARAWRVRQVLDRRYALPAGVPMALHGAAAVAAGAGMMGVLMGRRRGAVRT